MKNFDHLLNQYRLLWNHRLLHGDLSSEEILRDAIWRDLKDENSHPRIRKTIFEKFYLSTKRILDSSLSHETKCELVALHLEIVTTFEES